MKFGIEDYLYSLDNTLSKKNERDKMMIYVMIFFAFFAVSYSLFWDSAEQSFEESHQKALAMQSKLDEDKSYLQTYPPERLDQIDADTTALLQKKEEYVGYNRYINEKLEQISSLYYDKVVWGAYLNSISHFAKVHKVKLDSFANSLQTDNSSFGHVLDITISANAPYKNVLKFINSLEESQLVVDLHTIDMKADDHLKSDLNISVWGIVKGATR